MSGNPRSQRTGGTNNRTASSNQRTGERGSNQAGKSGDRSISKRMENMKVSNDDSTRKSASSSKASSSKGKVREIHYSATQIVGKGTFGVVYRATVGNTGEVVAIKKVLQDRRFKNRELQIMKMIAHPNVVSLRHSFYAKGGRNKDEVYLNLVMEFIPDTVHHILKNYTEKLKQHMPIVLVKVYLFQICRAIAYIHSLGICHRDVKPHNLLMNARTHVVKLCDFGSAKILVQGQPNVAYICSRYYRAPELVFEATEYTTAIDVWSVGCVMAELLLGKPVFLGQTRVDQLIEIVKILGTPTRSEIKQMNPNHKMYKFPQLKGKPWAKVFRNNAPVDAIDLVSQFLQYLPTKRITCFKALAHPFFDELRRPKLQLPDQSPCPTLFELTESETKLASSLNLLSKILPST